MPMKISECIYSESPELPELSAAHSSRMAGALGAFFFFLGLGLGFFGFTQHKHAIKRMISKEPPAVDAPMIII